MQPLIDADVLLHEIGWSGEFKDKKDGEHVLLPFESVEELLTNKIRLICEDVEATQPPILFVSSSDRIVEIANSYYRLKGLPELVHTPNFRYEVAKTRPYKGNRKNPKPLHFENIFAHMLTHYDVVVSQNGLEADDEMSIEQFKRKDTIICSRDKDLRITPGRHFSWECGKQRSIGPEETDELGFLVKDGKKYYGYGKKFFYFQMLCGDVADNIPGLKGWGEVYAYQLINPLKTEEEMFKTVRKAYIEVMGKENAKEYFLEQANLLWIRQEEGKGYELP